MATSKQPTVPISEKLDLLDILSDTSNGVEQWYKSKMDNGTWENQDECLIRWLAGGPGRDYLVRDIVSDAPKTP